MTNSLAPTASKASNAVKLKPSTSEGKNGDGDYFTFKMPKQVCGAHEQKGDGTSNKTACIMNKHQRMTHLRYYERRGLTTVGGQNVSTYIAPDLKRMINAYKQQTNETLTIASGYRPYAFGGRIGLKDLSKAPGYYSEHHTGLVVDLGAAISDYKSVPKQVIRQWNWLNQNAHKYNFRRSFTVHTAKDNGIVTEEWHYHWIGDGQSKESLEARRALYKDRNGNPAVVYEFDSKGNVTVWHNKW